MDFGVMVKEENGERISTTALIEVNEGFSLGVYEGLSAKDFTDLLIARWGQLLKGIP